MNAVIVTTAPFPLWREMSALIHQLFGLFGEPQHIAALQLIDRTTHALLSKWLRGCECVLRHLLLIEASNLPLLEKRRSTAKQSEGDQRRGVPLPASPFQAEDKRHDLDHPETWRVSFRVFSAPARGGSVGRAADSDRVAITSPASGGRNAFRSAWPLALRAEALLRAFNDPLPFARRLAARLRRQPRRAAALIATDPRAHHGVVIAEFLANLSARAMTALRAFTRTDSS